MKRIDTLNARPDLFGVGKTGFHDNADLPGQDATYLSPDWLNHLQEELCNVLELNGVPLNPDLKNQLAAILITKNHLVNDLITGGTDKVLTAEQGKLFFAMFANSKLQNGYQKLPNGLIIQWGHTPSMLVSTVGTASGLITFPISYPNAGLCILTSLDSTIDALSSSMVARDLSKNGFATYYKNTRSDQGVSAYWLSIGH